MLAIAPGFVFALTLLVAIAKRRYFWARAAAAVYGALAALSALVLGTAIASDVPFSEAWAVVLLQLAGWPVALAAATGPARPGSWWERSGRPDSLPARVTIANFVWVFTITLLGILFAGVDILGAVIFCALFGGLLAAVLLLGLAAARTRPVAGEGLVATTGRTH